MTEVYQQNFVFFPVRHKLLDAVHELSRRLWRSDSTHQLQTVASLLLLLLLAGSSVGLGRQFLADAHASG